MKKYIHINKQVIGRNNKNGTNDPPITVKTYKTNTYGQEVEVVGPCRVIHSPTKPLSCGARVYLTTEAPVNIYDSEGNLVHHEP